MKLLLHKYQLSAFIQFKDTYHLQCPLSFYTFHCRIIEKTKSMEDIDYTNELPNSSQLEFKRYLSAIWKRKWLIILLGVITAIPFYRSNKNSIPIYRSSVLIKTNAFNQDEQDKIL